MCTYIHWFSSKKQTSYTKHFCFPRRNFVPCYGNLLRTFRGAHKMKMSKFISFLFYHDKSNTGRTLQVCEFYFESILIVFVVFSGVQNRLKIKFISDSRNVLGRTRKGL